MSSDLNKHQKVGEGVMVASVEPAVRVKVRDKLRVAMRPSRLHVFDAKTEAAI
jgi:multiple sugar transport system ATP-binding protein